ncbi:MAG: hypothetical protein Q7W45_10865 [Bacteroidota bacterium]|nr:hypothetical protein [Bacteroidota bacterium]MDP3147176.1 hypothetical protein [Bacteroidota bacterium]
MNKKIILNSFLLALLFTQCAAPETIDNKAIKVVKQFNSQCPMMIDAETRMDGIEIKAGNTIVYIYTLINLQVENVDTSKFNVAVRPGIITTIKTNKELDELKRINSNFEYYYKDRNGKFIYSFVITPNDYNI